MGSSRLDPETVARAETNGDWENELDRQNRAYQEAASGFCPAKMDDSIYDQTAGRKTP